ncbi:HEAT repeat domain-containing protein [bacterium]|nr:HEAT repeat domain-containing protein [bacterium]
MQKSLTVLFVLFAFLTYADSPNHIIAILENERKLEAEPDVKLSSFFKSKDASIRSRAILAAGRIGNPAILTALQRLEKDPNTEVRIELAFALGQIRSRKGLPMAITLLKDQEDNVKRLAIESLGKIGALESVGEIIPFLDHQQTATREQAALALALIKDRNTTQVLIDKAGKEDPAQWSYVYALYRLADRRAIPVLHQVLANPSQSPSTGDPSSILFASKAFWTLKESLNDAEYKSLLQHSDQRIRQNALDVAAAAGKNNVCNAIHDAMATADVNTRSKSVEAMGSLGCGTIEERMKMLGDQDEIIRASAIQLIRKEEKDELIPIFQRAVSDDSWIVRAQVARSIPGMGRDYALLLLQKLMSDQDSAVRLAAIESLGEYMPESAEILEPLLKSADFAIRATAADILSKSGNPKYIPMLIDAYAMSSDPAEIEGRASILDALALYHDSRVISALTTALKDPEYTVRQRAIEALKKVNGNELFQDGVLHPLDDFLFLSGKVSMEAQSKYPADFGKPVPDFSAEMQLEKGTVVIRLLGKEAPMHVLNFKNLADKKIYDGLRIHRVVPNFVIQGGDPRGDGWGTAGMILHDQMNHLVYKRGSVGMPLAGKDTGGSQFFITMSRQPHLDGNYTIFGEVISGMEFVDSTEIGDKIKSIRVQNFTEK